VRKIFVREKPDQDRVDLDLVVPYRRSGANRLTLCVVDRWVPFWNHLRSVFEQAKIYKVLVPFYRLLFGHRKEIEPRLPGAILALERSNPNAPAFTKFKRWLQARLQAATLEEEREVKVPAPNT
jgi:hypothetical protein